MFFMFLESLTYDICMYFVSGMCMWECTELDIKQYLIFCHQKACFFNEFPNPFAIKIMLAILSNLGTYFKISYRVIIHLCFFDGCFVFFTLKKYFGRFDIATSGSFVLWTFVAF